MTEEQFKGFGDMMEVFEAAGRVTGTGNSITMPAQEAAKDLRKGAGLADIFKPIQATIDFLEDARAGKLARKQVEILNDPEGLKRLKELRAMSPNSQRFTQGLFTLFGVSASPE
jgi:hypothetical protein